MTNVAREYVLLDANDEAIEVGQLKTRPLAQTVGSQQIRVATDTNAHRHLLVPSGGSNVRPDSGAVGISIDSHPMIVDGQTVDFVDVHCQLPHLGGVFVRFAQDILDRLAEDPEDPPAVCRRTLAEWRAFLKNVGKPIGRELVEGIIGELTVLGFLGANNPAAAVEAWDGPDKALHDFACVNAHLEVKATASIDGKVVNISNLDQLDPAGSELSLAVVHLGEDGSAPGIDETVDGLVAKGFPRHALLTKVNAAGYIAGSGADADYRYRVRSVRLWRVGDDFPGLRRSHIPESHLKGVGRVRYELNLDTAPARLDDDAAAQFLAGWIKAEGV